SNHRLLNYFPTRRSSDLSLFSNSSRNTRTPSRNLRNQPSNSSLSTFESGRYSPTDSSLLHSSRSFSASSPKRPNRPEKTLSILTDRKSTRLNSSHVKISY